MASESNDIFDAWPREDQLVFQQHCNAALAKSANQGAKLINDFGQMKEIMIRNKATNLMTLAPHMVGISLANRDGKRTVAEETMTKGNKSSRSVFQRASAIQRGLGAHKIALVREKRTTGR